MIIDGKSFATATPITETLKNDKVLIVGPSGVLVKHKAIVSLPITRKGGTVPQTGMFYGESYTIEPDRTLVIDGKSFGAAST